MRTIYFSYFVLALLIISQQAQSKVVLEWSLNGRRQTSDASKLPKLIRGDSIELHSIRHGNQRCSRIVIDGYDRVGEQAGSVNDANVVVDTGAHELSQAIKKGNLKIVGFNEDVIVAKINFKVLTPEWIYSELMVNERSIVSRPGDVVRIGPRDKIGIVRIETNLDSNEKVSVSFVSNQGKKFPSFAKVLFRYREFEFGHIVIKSEKP